MERILLAISLALWAFSAYTDYRQRYAPNWIWPPLVAIGAVLNGFVEPLSGSIGTSIVGYWLWRRGVWGGADAKALIVLPWTLPGLWPAAIAASAVLSLGVRYVGADSDEVPYLLSLVPAIVLLALS